MYTALEACQYTGYDFFFLNFIGVWGFNRITRLSVPLNLSRHNVLMVNCLYLKTGFSFYLFLWLRPTKQLYFKVFTVQFRFIITNFTSYEDFVIFKYIAGNVFLIWLEYLLFMQ